MKYYDEIEWFKNNKSLYKTCLPELSNKKLRQLICKNGGVEYPDRFIIMSEGKIRLDSNKELELRNEIDIYKFYYRSIINPKDKGEFWGRQFQDDEGLYIEDVETKIKYRKNNYLINT